jgi:hypothetical protein
MIGDHRARIAVMTQFYDLDAANAAVPELDRIMTTLVDQRAELIRLRDEVLTRGGASEGAPTAVGGDLRLTRLRMQGLIDQMAAGVARIDAMGITLRDIENGLVDFPALVSGRQIWLCWRLGEKAVDWGHDLDAGFSGRRPLAELA